jgi:ParB/RepB/Spo0J family partition protein
MTTAEIAHVSNPAAPRLALSAIVPSLTNPRTHFDPTALQELAQSIKSLDVLQPILVRRLPGSRVGETFTDRRKGDPLPTHEIVAGERRYRAAKLAGLESVPVLERELSDDQVLHMQIVENLQREGLHPLEEAEAYRRILDLPSQAEKSMELRVAALANEVKKSPRYIYVTLQLLKLCDFARGIFMRPNVLPRSIALQIATIGNEAGQIEATKRICGLVQQGKEWVQGDAGLTQREAAQYVRDNHRLVLSKAPFPIKVVFAGVTACTECEKNTDNSPHLVDESEAKRPPATCTDPSCYGKKNTEHAKQVAEAARQAGQKVITGKAAEKIAPYESRPDTFTYGSEYMPLSAFLYSEVDPKHSGKTVKQLLGADIPKPVLIERADGKGFIEALPKKDVLRLLKERGLTRKASSPGKNDDQRAREAKAKREKEWRTETAQQLLAAVPGVNNQDALRSQLLLPMMVQIFQHLGNDATKHLLRLLQWEDSALKGYPSDDKVANHLKTLDGTQINQYIVAAQIASELQVPTWSSSYQTPAIEDMCELLDVDGEAIRAKQNAERKEAEKAKVAKRPAVKKVVATKTAAPARKTSTKKAHGPSSKPVTDSPASAAAKASEPQEANADSIPVIGDTVRVKERLKGHGGKLRKCCGKTGRIASRVMGGDSDDWMVAIDGGDTVRLERSEFVLTIKPLKPAGAPAIDPSSARPFSTASKSSTTAKAPAKKAAAKGANGAKKGNGSKEIDQGELELDNGTKLKPQPAWPFPTVDNPDPFGKGARA